jgi:hypothetical protein
MPSHLVVEYARRVRHMLERVVAMSAQRSNGPVNCWPMHLHAAV